MTKEGNPILFSGLEAGLKRSGETRKAREKRDRAEAIFRRASGEDLTRLTNNQRRVLNLYLPSEGKGLTLQRIAEESGATYQAIGQTRDGGTRRLEKLQRGESIINRGYFLELEMDPDTRNLLLQTSDLSEIAHCRMLGRSNKVVGRWRGEVGIEKNPVGRPRKSEPSS